MYCICTGGIFVIFIQMLTDFDEELSECHCYSHTVCQPGDQVFICYGTRPNSDFLVHNGFVYPDNPNDTVQLKLGKSPYCAT